MSVSPEKLEGVWLVHGWSKVAHSTEGRTSSYGWTTRCGRTIRAVQKDGRATACGVIIDWGLLDHRAVRLCQKCWQ